MRNRVTVMIAAALFAGVARQRSHKVRSRRRPLPRP